MAVNPVKGEMGFSDAFEFIACPNDLVTFEPVVSLLRHRTAGIYH